VIINAIIAFGGVALLGLIGFLYAWFSIRRKSHTRRPNQQDQRSA
jgi:hypothetical protein